MTADKGNQADKIIAAAFECLSLKGYANVSLRDIANEAGVALSQLHYYYGSKKDLFKELILKVSEKFSNDLENYINKSPAASLTPLTLVKYFQEAFTHNSKYLRVLYDLLSLALWSDTTKQLLSGFFNDVSNRIEELLLDNSTLVEQFNVYKPKTLSRMLLGSMLGIALQGLFDTNNNNNEIMDTFNATKVIFD